MSIRIKAILIIAFTNLLIILFSVFAGTMYVSMNIRTSQEAAMSIVGDIADHFVSSEIELLNVKASKIANSLEIADEALWPEILERQISGYPEFIGAAVFDIGLGRIAAAGAAPAPSTAVEDTGIGRAFLGGNVLDTTHFYNNELVFYLAIPMQDTQERILTITIPGVFFHEKLKDFVVWESGHIFLLDAEGTFVSNPRINWVEERYNTFEMSAADESFMTMMVMVDKMLRGESGVEYYYIYDVERVAAYRPVRGSEDGWSLGTVAPIPESPFRDINSALLMVGVVAFLLSIIVALIFSIFIKKPFERIAELKEEAELNSKYKTQFLANMSHEIRTPLTAVLGLTELSLRTAQLDNETHSNLTKVYRAGETLLSLVNDILDISKIEADKLVLNPREYDVPSLINDAITQNVLYIGEKPVGLILDIKEDLPNYLYGDDLRIKQILNNLLSNALKFTEEGTVNLGVRCQRDGDTIWLTICVRDTGIGIRSEDIGKLFALYGKIDDQDGSSAENRRIEGTGLGLSISKRVAEMMDGSITVESEYGKGSVFTVRLRQKYVNDDIIGSDVVESLEKFDFSMQRFESAAMTRVNLSYARILVVDDNHTNLDVAKGLMGLYGMAIDCVTSGQQAIDVVQEEKIIYDAIFMDHMMPGMDGIEATRFIREEIGSDYAKNIPIIALTANAIIGNKELFLSKGFHAFISKPIEIPHLDSVLRQWVRNKEREALLPNKIITLNVNRGKERKILREEIPGLDINKGIAHFGFSEDAYVKVLKSYVTSTRQLLDIIADVNADNMNEYAVTVHGIKGASRGIFADKVGDAAEALENAVAAGNSDFVTKHNVEFIDTLILFLDNIDRVISNGDHEQKPKREMPGKSSLKHLMNACDSFDIDDIDVAMTEIESYEYTADDGVVSWLRENLDQGKYKNVKDKLIELLEQAPGDDEQS